MSAARKLILLLSALPVALPALAQPIQPPGLRSLAGTDASGANVTTIGSTARTLAAHFGEVINALDAGLVCDGATDNAPVFAAIRTKTQAKTGQTVFFPPAALPCMSSTNLNTSNGTTYFAYPGTMLLKATPGSTASPSVVSAANVSNVLVEGIGIDGNQSGATVTNNAVTVFGTSNVVLDTILVQNVRGVAVIFSSNVSRSGIKNSKVINAGSIQVAGGTGSISGSTLTVTATTNGAWAVGAQVYSPTNPAMAVQQETSATRFTIAAYGTAGTTGTGGNGTYSLIGGTATIASGPLVAYDPLEANAIASISFCCGTQANNQDNFAIANQVITSGLDGISVGNQTRAMVRDNVLTYPNRFGGGIYFSNNNGIDVKGNIVYGAAGNGIDGYINSDILVEANHSNNNGGGGIQFASTTLGHIDGNTTLNNLQNSASKHKAGLVLGGEVGDPATTGVTLSSNVSTDTQTVKTQAYGFQIRTTAVLTTPPFIGPDNQLSGNAVSNFGEQATGPSAIATGGLSLPQTTPGSSSAVCTTGSLYADAGFIYACTGTNTWKRSALSTF